MNFHKINHALIKIAPDYINILANRDYKTELMNNFEKSNTTF